MPVDIVLRLYLCAEALNQLARGLPEQSGGLVHLLDLLSKDLNYCARVLDEDKTQN